MYCITYKVKVTDQCVAQEEGIRLKGTLSIFCQILIWFSGYFFACLEKDVTSEFFPLFLLNIGSKQKFCLYKFVENCVFEN